MPTVLVTDASERAALAVIRSLGKRRIEVTGGDAARFNIGFLSKYCKQKILYPSPELHKTRFVESMLKLVKEKSFDLVIPITDIAMVPIVERKEDFERYTKVAAPNYSTAIKALDKIETLKIAKQHSVSYPKTTLGEEVNNIREFSKEITYPVVIRPRMKVTWVGENALLLKVTQNNYAYNAQDLVTKWVRLISILEKVGLRRNFLMIQDFVKGEGYGVEALMHKGEPKAIFMHRRLREYPATGGASTLRQSVKDDSLAQLGIRLLQAMGWEGVAMVEFRTDARTGKPELIEVNGRFWGSLPLAINSGVDFPYLLYKTTTDEGNFVKPAYRVGLKQRWLTGEFLWLYSSLTKGDGITKSAKEFFATSIVPDDIMTLDDMNPLCGQFFSALNFLSDVTRARRNMAGEIIP